jgi:hypothetical protein
MIAKMITQGILFRDDSRGRNRRAWGWVGIEHVQKKESRFPIVSSHIRFGAMEFRMSR